MPAFLYVYVENVDAALERAVRVGAPLSKPHVLPYGATGGAW